MTCCLQFGAGMQDLGRKIVRAHPQSPVILSPKDFKTEDRLLEYAATLHKDGGKVLVDPQLYLDCMGNRVARIPSCAYWRHRNNPTKLVETVLELNRKIGTDSVILPTPYLDAVDESHMAVVREIADAASGVHEVGFLTICLNSDFFRSERQYNRLCKLLESIDVPGVYLLAEHVDDDYFTDDPVWLHRLFELCADIKMSGKKVLVGYSSHQQLPLACVGVEGLAVGKSRTTRIFWMNSFAKAEEGDVGFARPKPSYYCPQALTEFSLKYMDLARAEDIVELMRPDPNCQIASAVDTMLNAASPISSGYSLQDGYLHYFDMLEQQSCEASTGRTFAERLAWQMKILDAAESLLSVLHKHRVRGLLKDFSKYIGVARSALQALDETRGLNLSMHDELYRRSKKEELWTTLSPLHENFYPAQKG